MACLNNMRYFNKKMGGKQKREEARKNLNVSKRKANLRLKNENLVYVIFRNDSKKERLKKKLGEYKFYEKHEKRKQEIFY